MIVLLIMKTFYTTKFHQISTNTKCSFCNGTGIIKAFLHRDNGLCYSCNGSGHGTPVKVYSTEGVNVIPSWSELLEMATKTYETRQAKAVELKAARSSKKRIEAAKKAGLEKFKSELVDSPIGRWIVLKYTDYNMILVNSKGEKFMAFKNQFKLISKIDKAINFENGEKKYNAKFEVKYDNPSVGEGIEINKVDAKGKIHGIIDNFNYRIGSIKQQKFAEYKVEQ